MTSVYIEVESYEVGLTGRALSSVKLSVVRTQTGKTTVSDFFFTLFLVPVDFDTTIVRLKLKANNNCFS